MSQMPQTLTCPAGHTFPYEQLTVRDGLSVCPVCDRTQWAAPGHTWSRRLLTSPLSLLAAAVVMFLVEAVSGIGIGAAYQHANVSGAGWLIAGSAINVAGLVVVVIGILRAATALRRSGWSRGLLKVPLVLIAIGAAVVAVGDLVSIGLNVAFVNGANPGAGWQITAQVFDALFFTGIAAAAAWAATLIGRRDATESDGGAEVPTSPAVPVAPVATAPPGPVPGIAPSAPSTAATG